MGLLKISSDSMGSMIVSIQGIRGSFHDIAACRIYGADVFLLDRGSFREVFEDVDKGRANIGIVAVENTIAGPVPENYRLIKKYNFKVVKRYTLRIKHNLLALPNQKLSDIKEVRSHPMAIKQCMVFLDRLGAKLISTKDTAASAKEISEKKLTSVGAIASSLAAKLYRLDILAEGIEDNKENSTRFLAIGNTQFRKETPDKASIIAWLKHEPGALARLLAIFAEEGINLTKIESRPIVGKPWEYLFYIDYELSMDNAADEFLLDRLVRCAEKIQVLGFYQKSRGAGKN